MATGKDDRETRNETMEPVRGGRARAGDVSPFQRMIDETDWLVDQMQRSFVGGSFPSPWMGRRGEGPRRRMPRLDVDEREDALVLTAELPGIDPEQVHVEWRESTLIIRGERRDEGREGARADVKRIPITSESRRGREEKAA
jgi:HSP20 family protein